MITDSRKEVYNKYENMPLISYNCAKYLMDNNDLIWKLLYYNDKDAYRSDSDHPNLTKAQKGNLIYNGSPNVKDYRIFFDFGQDPSITDEISILRITPIELIPTNYIYGEASMAMEIYTHFLIDHLSNYQTRLNMIAQQLIEVFNGSEIGGLGRLFFDSSNYSRCRMTIGGETPFKGNIVTFCNWMA